MHGYCSNCAFLHKFTPTDVGVFLLKLCKMSTFFHFAQFYINWCNCSNNFLHITKILIKLAILFQDFVFIIYQDKEHLNFSIFFGFGFKIKINISDQSYLRILVVSDNSNFFCCINPHFANSLPLTCTKHIQRSHIYNFITCLTIFHLQIQIIIIIIFCITVASGQKMSTIRI